MPPRLPSKIALIAGAASGIGRATAALFAAEGATVICTDQHGAAARDTVLTLPGPAVHSAMHLDVTSESEWETVIAEVLRNHGRLDVLVNSAGISYASPIVDMTLDDWRRVLAVNLEGCFLGTKHAIQAIRANATGGSIVNVASVTALRAAPGASAYGVSKAGIVMLSRTAALECQQAGLRIRVNSVCPGGVKTPLWTGMPFFQDLVKQTGSEEAAYAAMAQSTPNGRFAEPAEIAQAILYLASDESLFVTGTELVIDNGYSAWPRS